LNTQNIKVVMSYKSKHDELEVLSEEEDRQGNTWTIVLRTRDGGRYTVVIGSNSGYPSTYKIKRETE
jgi:hypothetical protein